jgi:hypothetical protein
MKSNLFALSIAGVLLAACGGEDASETAQSTATADAAAEQPASATPATPPAAAVQGTQADYAPGELLPGGAVDVLQREGFRPPA